jgi:hypothetical protein
MDHLQKGDEKRGRAAEIAQLPGRDSRLYLVPQALKFVDNKVLYYYIILYIYTCITLHAEIYLFYMFLFIFFYILLVGVQALLHEGKVWQRS